MMVLALFVLCLLGYFPSMVFSQAHVFRPAQVSSGDQGNEFQISSILQLCHKTTGDNSLLLFSVSKPFKVDLAQWEARRSVYEEDSATRFFVFFANVSRHEDLRSTLE